MSKALASLASIAVRNRELIWELTRREVMQPQANHFLGRYWLFMHPALSILVLFSVFYFIYPTRLEGVNPRGFEVYLLSALIPWVVISELMARATSSRGRRSGVRRTETVARCSASGSLLSASTCSAARASKKRKCSRAAGRLSLSA